VSELRVALVKSAGRAEPYGDAIREAGAVPVLVSPYRVEPVEGSLDVLSGLLAHGPAWLALTSTHAVPVLETLAGRLGDVRVAAVGPGTATALQATGLRPSLVGEAGGGALARQMIAAGAGPGDLVIHAAGEVVHGALAEELRAGGCEVEVVPVYRMVPDPVGERAAGGAFAAVVVGSPRLAERAAELFPARPPVVALGATTADALRRLGWEPAAVAERTRPEDITEALARVLPEETER